MKNLLVLIAAIVSFSSNVHATNISFDLDIFSSGEDIYACNAGMMHQGYQGRVCYERDNPTLSCDPGLCTDERDCSCVCTGDVLNNSGVGESRLDFFNVTFGNWTNNGAVTNSSTLNIESGDNSFKQVVIDKKAFNKKLQRVSFQLGSERYGSVYFLDVCYRAAQVNHTSPKYIHNKQVTVSDLSTNGFNYEELAGLAVKVVAYCKAKGQSWYKLEETSWTRFNSSDIINYATKNIRKNLEACKVRYLFKESHREGLASIRRQSLQKARVCTYTSFNDDGTSAGLCPSGHYYSYHKHHDGRLTIQCHTTGGHTPYKYFYNYNGNFTHIQENDNSRNHPGKVEPKYPGLSREQCAGQYIEQPVNIPGERQYVCTRVK